MHVGILKEYVYIAFDEVFPKLHAQSTFPIYLPDFHKYVGVQHSILGQVNSLAY